MCKQISLIGAVPISWCVTHSCSWRWAVVVSRPGAGLLLLPYCHCSSFQWEKLYFHCQAMKCLCMTAAHTTINLTPAELTGQKPMQPLPGTEHYQCMDSLFIRGSIRHRSLPCHIGYETDSKSMLCHTQHCPHWSNTVKESCTGYYCIFSFNSENYPNLCICLFCSNKDLCNTCNIFNAKN